MEKDDIFIKRSSQRDPVLSLYTEEEIEGVTTTSSFIKSDTVATGQVSEVSSTSEESCKAASTSGKSIFMDLYEEEIVNTEIKNVNNTEKDPSGSDVVGAKKRKPGLLLLGEYADSGNDTEEEMLNSLKAKQEISKDTMENKTDKDVNSEHVLSETVSELNELVKTSVESDVISALEELPLTVGKVSSPVPERVEDSKDGDSLVSQNVRQGTCKLERSISKEEGQISAESDSSDSEHSSESRKDSKKHKDTKKDKSKKKDKKKKKKKRKKQKHLSDKKDSDLTGDEKKERKIIRSRSRETSAKRRSFKHSRSRSRDRTTRNRGHSRSRSQDKWKRSRHVKEKSRRSRSRSSSKRRSASHRKRDLKSRSRSPQRSISPHYRRRERGDKWSSTSRHRRDSPSTSRNRRDSPLTKKRRISRSRSPHKRRGRSPDYRRSRSPRKRSYSPRKRRRTSSEKSPSEKSPPRKNKSPRRRERKQSQTTPVKSSHRTSSASDSVDSGHFTNIPLAKTSRADEPELDNKEPVQRSSPVIEKEEEPSVLPKSTDVEKQFSPIYSPEKPWEDEFDFVFTEHMSPKQGNEKSMEDVLFGSEAKTPDLKRPTAVESKKHKAEPPAKKEEKKEQKREEKVTASEETNVSQKEENQDGSSSLQQPISATPESVVTANGQNISSCQEAVEKQDSEDKSDLVKKRNSGNDPKQSSTDVEKSAFVQSKLEVIPFLDEAPSSQPPVGSGTVHKSQMGILGSPPAASTGLLLASNLLDKCKNELQNAKKDHDITERSMTGLAEASPMDMEMSSPEGDIIDRMNEEFWKQQQLQQQQHQGGFDVTELQESKSRDVFTVESAGDEQLSSEEPYEPESGLIIGEEYEDLNSITDPKERRKREKQQQKEKTKVQELIDKLHRQARVEEEVKHVLKAYYKHRDIDKEEYKSILRRAVPQVTNSSSAIDPERIRSLVKKYVAKIKGQRVDSLE